MHAWQMSRARKKAHKYYHTLRNTLPDVCKVKAEDLGDVQAFFVGRLTELKTISLATKMRGVRADDNQTLAVWLKKEKNNFVGPREYLTLANTGDDCNFSTFKCGGGVTRGTGLSACLSVCLSVCLPVCLSLTHKPLLSVLCATTAAKYVQVGELN